MSLVKTLAKVAAGAVVANSIKNMVGGGTARRSLPRTGRIGQASSGGGLEDMLGQILGGGSAGGSAGRSSGPGGSLQDMLGQVLAGKAGGSGHGGSMGGMLDELSRLSRSGGDRPATPTGQGTVRGQDQGSFGNRLDEALSNFGEPAEPPTQQEEDVAGVLLRAIIQAAKADGPLDPEEKQQLLGRLGDVSREEEAFVERELDRPLDVGGLAREVPAGSEQQVYMVSVMAIELDEQSEAKYLDEVARSLELSPATVNAIHDKLGAPKLYR